MGMFTDPDHIRIEDPGKIEGNSVFTYLDAFCTDEHFAKFLPDYKNLDELKAHYQRGGLGDVKVKKFLYAVLEDILEPIRVRRKVWEQNIEGVYQVLKDGTEAARRVGEKTLKEVKDAMQINYFDDAELIASQAEKYRNK
jgi:tryptophanyl-tRNA synthetase